MDLRLWMISGRPTHYLNKEMEKSKLFKMWTLNCNFIGSTFIQKGLKILTELTEICITHVYKLSLRPSDIVLQVRRVRNHNDNNDNRTNTMISKLIYLSPVCSDVIRWLHIKLCHY